MLLSRPGGLPTGGGGGNVSTFKGWWGGTNKLPGVNWKVPDVGVILLTEPSGRGNCNGCEDIPTVLCWCPLADICCIFGFLGPRSCCTAGISIQTIWKPASTVTSPVAQVFHQTKQHYSLLTSMEFYFSCVRLFLAKLSRRKFDNCHVTLHCVQLM